MLIPATSFHQKWKSANFKLNAPSSWKSTAKKKDWKKQSKFSEKRKSVVSRFNRSIDDSTLNNYEDIYGNFTVIHSPVADAPSHSNLISSKSSMKKDPFKDIVKANNKEEIKAM